ncbi:MAG: SgcJ/EcaC family oxidoreductase [Verrucomicrobiaceae bacterium]|nr:MAG: SgcJ/EcaC family oxidoreductase [Verrucomicrobiaceae bacterium]
MKAIVISLSFAAVLAGAAICEEAVKSKPEMSPEMAAVLANDRAYEAAHAKGDVAALAALFTEDAQYTSDDGRTFSGRPAIEACLRDAFLTNKGSKLTIRTDSVKALSPDVLVEKGATTVISKTGEVAEALFTAVHVKKDGAWKISEVVETPMQEISAGDRLAELAWLIGSWEEADKAAGVTVHSRFQWARGGNFITRDVTVKRDDDPVLEGWQIIAWDPVEGGIRSWTFDDAGGYSEGRWTNEGQRWLLRETGYAADGSRTSADNTITKADDDRFYWESGNRTLDGDPQPGIGRIEIERVKGK